MRQTRSKVLVTASSISTSLGNSSLHRLFCYLVGTDTISCQGLDREPFQIVCQCIEPCVCLYTTCSLTTSGVWSDIQSIQWHLSASIIDASGPVKQSPVMCAEHVDKRAHTWAASARTDSIALESHLLFRSRSSNSKR
jgi:hypothetical protein